MRTFCLLTAFLVFDISSVAQVFDAAVIRKHVEYLASDELEGRGTSSKGEELAAAYIISEFKQLGLIPLRGDYRRPFRYRARVNPHDTATAGEEKTAHNVVAYLDNGAKEHIVIGAHYDHLGLGHDHNSLAANPEGQIHNGADDNGSGTAGVLELARYFTSNNRLEPYNFIFICFSGEELGLLGSKKWCEDPDVDLSSINYMVNMDMIGRLNDSTKKLIVYGVGTSPHFVPILDSVTTPLVLKKDSSGIGPSDQTSFYLKNIPVLHFFTGQHSDYHKPGDDADKLNYKGQAEVLYFIAKVVEETFLYGKMPFSKTRNPDSGKVSFKVTLGVMPDYTYDGKGMRIDGVTDDRPAAKAGLLAGDIIVKLGDDEIKDIHAYMKALSRFKKGDSTTVEVERKRKIRKFNITF